MRVLIIRHGYYPHDPRVRREAGALIARGHEVDVLCLRAEGEAAREVVGGVDVTRLPVAHRRAGVARYLWEYSAFFAGASLLASWRQLRRRYDVVQVNTMPDALIFAALGPRLGGARVLLDLHEVMPELYATKFGVPLTHPVPRLLAAVEQAAVRFADACLAVSDPCVAVYTARGAPPAKFTVVMNSADEALFHPGIVTSAAPDETGDLPVLVSHGTLVERYGFDILLRALAKVPEARLVILGGGEAGPDLERLAAQLGVAGRVTFSGFVPLDEVPARIAGADVGVVANRSNAFTDLVVPTKLLEYVALAVPAVVARTPAVEAYFDPDMVSFFEPGNADDLARALREVLADPAERRRLAECATRFDTRYGWPVMAARYVRLVETLATGRSTPSP